VRGVSALLSHPAVRLSDLSQHVARLKSNDSQLFSHEYESIDPVQQFTWHASNSDENKVRALHYSHTIPCPGYA